MAADGSGGEHLEQLAYDLALRTLGQQERLLEELRARTCVLLTATAIVVSFLGGRALATNGDAWLTLTGTAAAIASIVLGVYVLLPKSGFTFALHGAAVYVLATGLWSLELALD